MAQQLADRAGGSNLCQVQRNGLELAQSVQEYAETALLVARACLAQVGLHGVRRVPK